MDRQQRIREHLSHTPLLARLCSQNGWIDNETLDYEVVAEEPEAIVANVHFDEVVMEGSGCVADRVRCFGKVRLRFDGVDQVSATEILQP